MWVYSSLWRKDRLYVSEIKDLVNFHRILSGNQGDPVSAAAHYGKLGTFPSDYNSIHNAEHMPDPSLIYFD